LSCTRFDLAVGRDDVNDAEERHERYTDDPQQQLLPEIQRLQEAHLRSEPDAGEMLLAVWMRYELQQHPKRFSYRCTLALQWLATDKHL